MEQELSKKMQLELLEIKVMQKDIELNLMEGIMV